MEYKVHFAPEQDRQIAGLLTFASDDETRPELCGILLEVRPGLQTVRAVATNGHALGTLDLSAPMEVEQNHDLFLPWSAFGRTQKQAATALKKLFRGEYGSPIVLTYQYDEEQDRPTEFTLCNTATASSQTWKSEHTKFPDWRRVVPNLNGGELEPTAAIGLNLKLMAPYFTTRYKAGSTCAGSFVPSVMTGDKSAMVFADQEDQSFLGLIMPLRMQQDANEVRQALTEKLTALHQSS